MSEPEPDRSRMPQTLPVEKPVCSPGEPVQRQSGKEGNDETEIKNRSQNGKAASKETKRTIPRGKNKIVKDMVLRRRKRGSFGKIYSRPRSKDQMDSVDWEAVRQAETSEIASIIEARGQQTIIAGSIKVLEVVTSTIFPGRIYHHLIQLFSFEYNNNPVIFTGIFK
jgi:hypothetical protein